MKRFFSALALCLSLLAVMSAWFYRAEAAKENAILTLLNLPAPPPPNPLVKTPTGTRPAEFYDRHEPPPDNAPIEDLLDYWSKMSSSYAELSYNPRPSSTVTNRIMRELQEDPERIVDFLNVMKDDRRAEEMARALYQKLDADNDEDGRVDTLKNWLKMNTDDFSGELETASERIRDVNEYVDKQEDLLALTKVNWYKAEPIVTRMYNDNSQKASQVLATWAMYKRALESGGSDVDKYRDELKAVVENKEATPGMRDLALDALLKEGSWSGRDDWYIGLLGDETLAELRVRGSVYTGLTTIMYYEPDDRLSERMIGLMDSDNIHVRTAAAKNLLVRLSRLTDSPKNQELRKRMVESMLPWLKDKDWLKADSSQRSALVNTLQFVKMPEAVPALIEALNAKESRSSPVYSGNIAYNAAANAANVAANAISAAANAAAYASNRGYNASNYASNGGLMYVDSDYYPLRSSAVAALDHQEDPRAAAPLRRVLVEAQEWERVSIVKALLACKGFSTEEQVAAIEFLARSAGDVDEGLTDESARRYTGSPKDRALFALRLSIAEKGTRVATAVEEEDEEGDEFDNYGAQAETVTNTMVVRDDHDHNDARETALSEEGLKLLVGSQLVSVDDPDEALIRSTVDRIATLDPREPVVAYALRKVVLGWNGTAVNSLLLRDTRDGKLDADVLLKLLSIRKELREKQMSDVVELRSGTPEAKAIAACLLEDKSDYDSIVTSGTDAAKISLFACARLIRGELPIAKVVPNLKSPNKILAMAAERYLEAEDSHEARAAVLALYPNQAKILGATTAFNVAGLETEPGVFLRDLFRSVNPYFGSDEYAYRAFGHTPETPVEKRLQEELKAKKELVAIYSFDKQFVRIYADRAVFSWEDDPARYRERTLEPQQFDSLKSYFANAHVDELPPFLACSADCESRQLLMIGKGGGRRIFVKSERKMPEFFANLQGFFDEMKKQPSKLKYYAGEQAAPGLEVLFDDEKLAAMTVWKSGSDLRVLINDEPRENSIIREVNKQQESEQEQLEADEKNADGLYDKYYSLRETRRFEASSWFRIADGKLGEQAAQPAEVEYLPANDGLVPAAEFGQWTAKAAGFEIRADATGLYKLSAGRSQPLKRGNYSLPVVTTNGRWVIVTKYDENEGSQLVRVNLANGREYKVAGADLYLDKAICFVPSRNLVLVRSTNEYDDHHGEGDESYHESAYESGRDFYFLNPDTGAVTKATGEVRPLAQQSFRGLQPVAGSTTEFWAAIPRGKAGTLFGIYSTRNFSFKPVLKLPKIIFDSVEMWVEEGEKKAYFIHEGHLLSAPYVLAEARTK